MKKTLLFTLGLFLFSSLTFAQETSIKDFSLKNYKAPDIKYRTLDLGSSLLLNGLNETSVENNNYFSTNANLRYYEYRNTRKIQSKSSATFRGQYSGYWRKTDTTKGSSSSLENNLSYYTQTRIYNHKQAFFGIHGVINYRYNPRFGKNEDGSSYRYYQDFSIIPFISGGKGRIEPIESARQAMDILLALQKENRLGISPDSSMIDSLARVANRIRYKRFYDSRFKRVYQLEELDKTMQNMDLVETADMVYFANLNDIWNFAPQFNRGTGTRYEGGIIPKFTMDYYKNEDSDDDLIKHSNKYYGIYGFFSFNRMKPVSYAWQSDILIDLTFGYGVVDRVWEDGDDIEKYYYTSLNGLLNAGWQFGFYPNTRTFMGIKPYVAFSYAYDIEEKNKDVFGLNTGFRFDSYYYVSPRLRIELFATLIYLNNFSHDIPSPYWNRIDRYDLNSSSFVKGLVYNFSFSFKYAIF